MFVNQTSIWGRSIKLSKKHLCSLTSGTVVRLLIKLVLNLTFKVPFKIVAINIQIYFFCCFFFQENNKSNFFPFTADPFSERAWCTGCKQEIAKVASL